MKTLTERLQACLDADPTKSKAGLARACGVSKGAVTAWFNGGDLSQDSLLGAASYFGVNPYWLGKGSGQMRPTTRPDSFAEIGQKYTLAGMSEWDDSTPMDSDDVEIPLFKEVEMAAGNGMSHAIEINGRKLRFSKATLRAAGVDAANAACATITGTSMEPLILDGATIGIDRGRTQIKDGKIYAIDHGGMLRVKYLYRTPGSGVRLRSENADEYPDEVFTGEDAKQIRVLGWVFWWSVLQRW